MNKPLDIAPSLDEQVSGNESCSQEEFERLYRLYYGRVRSFFRCNGFKDEDAEDLAQDTFVRVLRKLASFRGESSPLNWILTIAYNLALNDRRRKHALKRWAPEDSLDEKVEKGALGRSEASKGADPERRAILGEAIQSLEQAVQALPHRQRACFQLWAKGYKYKEIAQLLDIKLDTVKSNLHLAREKIKDACPNIEPSSEVDDEEAR